MLTDGRTDGQTTYYIIDVVVKDRWLHVLFSYVALMESPSLSTIYVDDLKSREMPSIHFLTSSVILLGRLWLTLLRMEPFT